MIAIGVMLMGFSLFGVIWLSTKISDYHYKKRYTDAPLYIIYGYILVTIWAGIVILIIENIN